MLADRLKTLAPSATLAVQARAKAVNAQGIEEIAFSVGEPDFDTLERVTEAVLHALKLGQTRMDAAVRSLEL